MILKRQNVLELIGKDRRKYHSCILTCYSFDFSYFEERVMPVLRTANIKNINVLADGKFLETALENTTGKEFKHQKTYSINPIYNKGVFHPKIMFLTGIKGGLLIIGSGNITSSGISTNDEIWGAFHLDNINNENAALVSDVWQYIQIFTKQLSGFNTQKIEWINKYSPWLSELPLSTNKDVYLESINTSFRFVYNHKESIIEHLLELIPTSNLEAITIISPYYDKKGDFIQELLKHYNPKSINCVVDTSSGLLPFDLEKNKLVAFYEWQDCKDDFDADYNRLHAKLFHFQYSNNTEILVFGSANATSAAMGLKNKKHLNDEACLIIKRNSKSNYLKELGIKINLGSQINIDKASNKRITEQIEFEYSYKIKFLYAELKGNELQIFHKGDIGTNLILKLVDSESNELEMLSVLSGEHNIKINCKYPDDLFKVCLIDENFNQVTNFCLVHRLEYQLKSNPDPQQEKLDLLLDNDYPNAEGLTELLQHVDCNWADEDDIKNKSINSIQGRTKNDKSDNQNIENHEILSSQEFNKASHSVVLKQNSDLNNSSLKIAEFLNIIGKEGININNYNFDESEEQKLLEDKEQKGDGNEIKQNLKLKVNGDKERRAIANYYSNLDAQYKNHLDQLYKSNSLTESPKELLGIKNLSNMLIALQLIQLYGYKAYSFERDDENKKELKYEQYIPEGNLLSGVNSIKGFLIDTFGRFTLLSVAGFKKYEYDILNNRMIYFRRQVFLKSTFHILNSKWNEKEIDYRNTLLLNSLYFINSTIQVSLEDFILEIDYEFEKLKKNCNKINNSYKSNFEFYTKELLPNYFKWISIYKNDLLKSNVIEETRYLQDGNYIFNSKIGFNILYKKIATISNYNLSLKRAGYNWNEDKECCLLENVTYTTKSVIYRQ